MAEITDTIIVCGGKGTRMGELSEKCGCKSLVPILGIPAISYLTNSIRQAIPNSRIILAIDRPKLKDKFIEVYDKQGIANYQIYEGMPRGPVQAFYEAGSLCRSNKVLVFFGNQLVSPNHIKKMFKYDNETLVLSAFNLLSENNCKVATLDLDGKVLDVTRHSHLASLKDFEVYLDVPYVVPNNFFSMETFPEIKRLFVKTPMAKTCLDPTEKVVVEKSVFPAEFHFKEELGNLESLVGKYFSDFIKKFRSKF